MFFWDIHDSSTKAQFHRLKIVDEEVEELPIVSWTATTIDHPYPMLATAGKTFPMRIWSPIKDTHEIDESGTEDKIPTLQNIPALPETIPAQIEQVRVQTHSRHVTDVLCNSRNLIKLSLHW